jgi:hypothetical protein
MRPRSARTMNVQTAVAARPSVVVRMLLEQNVYQWDWDQFRSSTIAMSEFIVTFGIRGSSQY